MRNIIVIAHNIRSAHNVGSLLRTAEGLGVEKLYITGYTPYPLMTNDTRLPHIASKLNASIQKTALNAQESIAWEYEEDILAVINKLQKDGFHVCALEQTKTAVPATTYQPTEKIAILLGSEVTGVDQALLDLCDGHMVIPMYGKKESFNVVQAAAMVLFRLRFYS